MGQSFTGNLSVFTQHALHMISFVLSRAATHGADELGNTLRQALEYTAHRRNEPIRLPNIAAFEGYKALELSLGQSILWLFWARLLKLAGEDPSVPVSSACITARFAAGARFSKAEREILARLCEGLVELASNNDDASVS